MILAIDGSGKKAKNGYSYLGVAVCDDLQYSYDIEIDNSTNQRGELLGLLNACSMVDSYIKAYGYLDNVQIVTDSEYIYHSFVNEWYIPWEKHNWISNNNTVKNSDMWKQIFKYKVQGIIDNITIYCVKGHAKRVPKSMLKLIDKDTSLNELYSYIKNKPIDAGIFNNIKDKFIKTHGHSISDVTLLNFLNLNVLVDSLGQYFVQKNF